MSADRSLLVGVDFTRCSAAALREGLRLAARMEAELRAVHVIDALVTAEVEEALSDVQRHIREGLLADARRAWSEFAMTVPGAQAVPFEVTISERTAGIRRAVREHRADLLILGAFGRSPVDVGLGTMATACVRAAPSDVLLVRDTHAGPFRSIVAGVDFSETSGLALKRAGELALLERAELRVLHVFDPPWHRLHFRGPTLEVAPRASERYVQELPRRLAAFAGATLAALPPLPYACEVFEDHGHRSGLVAYAQETGADLIVLGTRGHSNLRDTFLGSTAEKVLEHTSCSVLAVTPHSSAGD
ncbi:MAG TPA: universal stress protein [Candidatus Polarisedimenticolaceae bacterium]|nr:universal stress protein [Candidatus Polarisedimenticolaceae bacterium]